MGVKYLNNFLLKRCSCNSINTIPLSRLKNKMVVIDAFIYIYKYVGENNLMNGIESFIKVLLKNGIIPVFIFDGTPPPEKNELIKQRRKRKKIAEENYKKNEELLNNIINSPNADRSATTNNTNTDECKKLIQSMKKLKDQFVKITDGDILETKRILTSLSVKYVVASEEADSLCAIMVKNGTAWGCITEDMDLFVYGCKYVFRNIDVTSETIIMYKLNSILYDLNLDVRSFREILVLSGTDYNIHSSINLYDAFVKFSEYKRCIKNTRGYPPFYKWLDENTNLVKDLAELNKIYSRFIV